jgi:hypothetical protein
VRAELIALPGMMSIHYQTEQDIFMITYRREEVTVPDMFAAIWMAGRKQGREFIPEQVD